MISLDFVFDNLITLSKITSELLIIVLLRQDVRNNLEDKKIKN